MRNLVEMCLITWAALVVGVACTGKGNDEVAALKKRNAALEAKVAQLEKAPARAGEEQSAPAALPRSLDVLYPPSAQVPVYTQRMTGMAMPGEAMISDLFEGDGKSATANFEAFTAQYKEVRELVPEWKSSFPMEPVEELGKALAVGDPNQVMPLVGKVGQICHNCHVEHMTAVQHKYHWKDTSAFKIEDPVTGKKLGYAELMHSLSGSLASVGSKLAQGKKDAAKKQLDAFEARFGKLEETCSACHSSERKYFVDKSVKGLIADFGKEVAKGAPDPRRLQQLGEQIGRESCFKCHLVHMPAALSRARGMMHAL